MVAMRHRGWLYVSSHACPVDAAGAHTMRMRRMDGNPSVDGPRTASRVGGSRWLFCMFVDLLVLDVAMRYCCEHPILLYVFERLCPCVRVCVLCLFVLLLYGHGCGWVRPCLEATG